MPKTALRGTPFSWLTGSTGLVRGCVVLQKETFDMMSRGLGKRPRQTRQFFSGATIIVQRDRSDRLGGVDAEDVLLTNEKIGLPKRVQG